MSKKHQEIFSNQSTEHENSILSKTGYSNSRLSVQTLGQSQPKLSFDAMTIVGDLNISLLFFLGFELQIWRTKRGGLLRPPPYIVPSAKIFKKTT